jgi:PilZ domain-containing protein
MTSETPCKDRRYQRITLPKGMTVAWYGGGDSQVSRVKTLGMGGLFLAAPAVRPVGTTLTLLFEVPGGFVQAQGVVRSIAPGEGMGVEFTGVGPQARALLDSLLKRLLQ